MNRLKSLELPLQQNTNNTQSRPILIVYYVNLLLKCKLPKLLQMKSGSESLLP